MDAFNADTTEIVDNMFILDEYRELRLYLLKRLAKLSGAITERRVEDARNLKRLLEILDVCAVVATDRHAVSAHNVLYYHLS
jgi:hypothetical protein